MGVATYVGCGRARITPPLGVSMAGYFEDRFAAAVRDELYAKALVFEAAGERAALVSCDVICIPDDIVAAIREQVESRTGIPGGNVMVAATHTHTGPRTRMSRVGDADDVTSTWMDEFPSLVANAVAVAAGDIEPCEAVTGTAYEDRIAFNRRFHMRDGSVRTNPGSRNADIVKPAGPIDPEVAVVAFRGARGGTKAVLVNYACHLDNVGGTELSADYPGYLVNRVRELLPDEPAVIYTQGACGDINHCDFRSSHPRKGHAHSRWMGETLAIDVSEAARKTEPLSAVPVRVASETIQLPIREGAEATITQTEIQAIRVGDVGFASIPAEYFVELQLDIKARSPFASTYVAELANGWVGYIPTRKAFEENMGDVPVDKMADFDHLGYEVRSALSMGFGPGIGEFMADTAVALLEKLHGE